MCISFLFTSDWGGEGSRKPGPPAYVGVRTACHSVTPDGSPPKHFTAFCPGLSSLEWSHWRLAVWLWAAHFPRLSPLFPSPFYEGRKPRFNKMLDLHSKITAQDKTTEWPCHIPISFSLQHHSLATPTALPDHAQLRDRQAPLPALRPTPAAGRASTRQ